MLPAIITPTTRQYTPNTPLITTGSRFLIRLFWALPGIDVVKRDAPEVYVPMLEPIVPSPMHKTTPM